MTGTPIQNNGLQPESVSPLVFFAPLLSVLSLIAVGFALMGADYYFIQYGPMDQVPWLSSVRLGLFVLLPPFACGALLVALRPDARWDSILRVAGCLSVVVLVLGSGLAMMAAGAVHSQTLGTASYAVMPAVALLGGVCLGAAVTPRSGMLKRRLVPFAAVALPAALLVLAGFVAGVARSVQVSQIGPARARNEIEREVLPEVLSRPGPVNWAGSGRFQTGTVAGTTVRVLVESPKGDPLAALGRSSGKSAVSTRIMITTDTAPPAGQTISTQWFVSQGLRTEFAALLWKTYPRSTTSYVAVHGGRRYDVDIRPADANGPGTIGISVARL